MKVSVFYLHTPVFCKTTQERIIGGTVTDTNFLGQLGHARKGRAVSAFFGVPWLIAVVIYYFKREEARGTFLESHFHWQIRTFWFWLLWCIVAVMLFITILGIPFALMVLIAAGIWAIYRIARGWLALRDRKAMYTSGAVRI